MAPLSRSAFAGSLASLDEQRLAAFVADLWAARGWSTSAGTPVVAERDGERRRIAVVAGRRLPGRSASVDPAGADVVVDGSGSDRVAAAAREAGAEYVGSAALRRQLLYAVPRPAAEDLAEQYLDRPLAVASRADDRRVRRTAGVVAVAVLLVAGTLLAGGVWSPVATDQRRAAAGTTATLGTPAPTSTAAAQSTSFPDPSAYAYPPGITEDGVRDASRLAAAHAEEVRNRQYGVDVSFTGPADATGFGDLTSLRWSLRVETPVVFRLNASRRGAASDERTRVERYAAGGTVYSRDTNAGETTFGTRPLHDRGVGAYASFVATLVERYLSTTRSTVTTVRTADGLRFHVVATGRATGLDRPADEYLAEAWVTPEGRVLELRVTYVQAADEQQREVHVSVEYGGFGTTTVGRPDWYDAARNATSGARR